MMNERPSKVRVVSRSWSYRESGGVGFYEGVALVELKDRRRYKRELRKWRAQQRRTQ